MADADSGHSRSAVIVVVVWSALVHVRRCGRWWSMCACVGLRLNILVDPRSRASRRCSRRIPRPSTSPPPPTSLLSDAITAAAPPPYDANVRHHPSVVRLRLLRRRLRRRRAPPSRHSRRHSPGVAKRKRQKTRKISSAKIKHWEPSRARTNVKEKKMAARMLY